MQNPQAVNDVIDHLATKLAVPTAHLWAILVRQAYVSIVPDLLLLVILAVAAKYWMRYWKAKHDDYDHELPLGASGVLLCVVAVFAVISTLVDIGHVLNPEYYALSQVLDALKPK